MVVDFVDGSGSIAASRAVISRWNLYLVDLFCSDDHDKMCVAHGDLDVVGSVLVVLLDVAQRFVFPVIDHHRPVDQPSSRVHGTSDCCRTAFTNSTTNSFRRCPTRRAESEVLWSTRAFGHAPSISC